MTGHALNAYTSQLILIPMANRKRFLMHFLKPLVSVVAGYLVSASIFNSTGEFYRENLYQFDHCGQLLGVLLSLGRGPRSMYPVYLPGDPDLSARYNDLCGQEGWHVYMRDGHDGIICVYLGKVYNRETS